MTVMSAEPAISGTPAALADSRPAVAARLRQAVDLLPEPARALAAYHFGWQAPDGTPLSGGPGKMLRPVLALEAAHAVGADRDVALPGAVAVELVHNSSLLKDDVADGDTTRRHRPTTWTMFGEDEAILASDALLVLATTVLIDQAPSHGPAALRELANAYQELVRGQIMDLRFQNLQQVSVTECRQMAAGKTAALMSCATRIGAILAGAPAEPILALAAFGWQIGLSFQFIDDILGIWGDPAQTGKPVGSDIFAKKKSLPVAYALAQPTDDVAELREFYAAETSPTAGDVAWATCILTQLGAREWAEQRAADHYLLAQRSLACDGLSADRQSGLRALAEYATRCIQ